MIAIIRITNEAYVFQIRYRYCFPVRVHIDIQPVTLPASVVREDGEVDWKVLKSRGGQGYGGFRVSDLLSSWVHGDTQREPSTSREHLSSVDQDIIAGWNPKRPMRGGAGDRVGCEYPVQNFRSARILLYCSPTRISVYRCDVRRKLQHVESNEAAISGKPTVPPSGIRIQQNSVIRHELCHTQKSCQGIICRLAWPAAIRLYHSFGFLFTKKRRNPEAALHEGYLANTFTISLLLLAGLPRWECGYGMRPYVTDDNRQEQRECYKDYRSTSRPMASLHALNLVNDSNNRVPHKSYNEHDQELGCHWPQDIWTWDTVLKT